MFEQPKITLSGEVIRQLDQRSISAGVPGLLLMENAALRTFDRVRVLSAELGCDAVWVVAGGGNNGGDGLAIARHVANWGAPVVLDLVVPALRLKSFPECWTNFVCAQISGVEMHETRGPTVAACAIASRFSNPLVVDALLGTGLRGEVRSPYLEWIEALNERGWPILSVDTPSGLDVDTGSILGTAIRARETVSFVAAKPGFFSPQGQIHTGRLVIENISIPRPFLADAIRKSGLEEKI